MSENRGGGSAALQVGLLLAAAFGLALIFAMWQIGASALRDMGLILVSGITLALVIGASALPIRAWRRRDFTGDHFHTDGTRVIKETRIIDGRAPAQTDVKLLQLPAQPQGAMYPELLRAAYQAGRISPASSALSQPQAGGAYDPRAAYTEADLPDVGFDGGDEWGGDITMPRP